MLRSRLPVGSRTVLAATLMPLLLALLTGAMAACGSTPSQLTVSLSPQLGDSPSPGDTLEYILEIDNQGPGSTSGVKAALDLPPGFTYLTTLKIGKDFLGATRLQDLEAVKDSASPQWGSWQMAAPSINADGTRHVPWVRIDFTVRAGGAPRDLKLAPRAVSDAVGSDTTGQPVAVHVQRAADLHMDLSVAPTQVVRNQDVLYRVTIDNFGTAPAPRLNVLVSLPPGVTFVRTESIQGNAARDQPVDPTPGALLVYYGGFILPAQGPAGPGALIITLRGNTAFATGGSFTASAQLTAGSGTIVSVQDVARITVTAPGVPPTPVPPTPAPEPTPTPPVATLPPTPPTG